MTDFDRWLVQRQEQRAINRFLFLWNLGGIGLTYSRKRNWLAALR